MLAYRGGRSPGTGGAGAAGRAPPTAACGFRRSRTATSVLLLAGAVAFAFPGTLTAQHRRTLDLGLGLAAHVSARTERPGSRWGTAASAGGDFLVGARWSLGMRARAATIPDDVGRLKRYALLLETRLRARPGGGLYGILGAGWGAATTVTRDVDLVSIGDEGGWVGVAGAGFLPQRPGRIRPGVEAVLLRQSTPGGALWTAMVTLRVRLRGGRR